MPIRLLKPDIVARIAAGEVIERPSSVVKELVENSLDAGATQINVEADGGGIGLIRVTDNGCGIPADEIELAFQRYATSKISGMADLESIASLGFRGEALPSIAAVSLIEVTTAVGLQAGSFIALKEGRTTEQRSQGRAPGTTITVRNLLRNVPARLKFLKSPATENSRIAEVVTQYALAYPEVKFSLVSEGRTVLRTPGNGRLADTVGEIYGLETARGMLELGASEAEWSGGSTQIKVSGMVGSPTLNRANRDYLSFFVNRRWISSKLLAWAVEEAYHGLLMTGRHPIAVINIMIPPGEVDVNIHPTKTEVKFRDERLVFGAVQRAVRRALIAQAPVPGIEELAVPYATPPRTSASFWSPPERLVSHAVHTRQNDQPTTPALSLPALRLLGQMADSYIVAEGPDGLYLIDQHAAHERIIFEQIRRQSQRREVEVQGLLPPATLEVTPGQAEWLRGERLDLSEFGFSIEPFGERSFLVRAIPLMLNKKDWAAALRELLDELAKGAAGDWREQMLISLACHGAIRAGQALSDEEMREMLRQLEASATPNSCPHGRPTMILLGTGQLEKEFRRT